MMPRYNRVDPAWRSLAGFALLLTPTPAQVRGAMQTLAGLRLPSLTPTPTPMES